MEPAGETPSAAGQKGDATPAMPFGRWPATGKFRFQETVTEEARREVERIREEALSLGWSEAQLYQNQGNIKFPSREYGLVCYLKGRTIEKVTADAIRLKTAVGNTLTFYQSRGDNFPGLTRISSKR